jgi:hypothetical protein
VVDKPPAGSGRCNNLATCLWRFNATLHSLRKVNNPTMIRWFQAKAAASRQPVRSKRIGRFDRGEGLAWKPEVKAICGTYH